MQCISVYLDPDPTPVGTGSPTKATLFYYYYGKNGDAFCHGKGNKTPAYLKCLNLLS